MKLVYTTFSCTAYVYCPVYSKIMMPQPPGGQTWPYQWHQRLHTRPSMATE